MLQSENNKEIQIYTTESGKQPFSQWLCSINDDKAYARICSRLDRLANGHYGDCKTLGGSICELRLSFGPGYRIYFGEIKPRIALLLCGGNKDSQVKDIAKARGYWKRIKCENL
ncbi:MAG: type II toxin-antitoxin system RelE/ParE family toxin [Legionellales bacterium]|jgi:putative addiction module killer protein